MKINVFVLICTFRQLFSDNDVFQQYGIPMNPTDTTNIPELMDRQRAQNDASPIPTTAAAAAVSAAAAVAATPTGSEVMSYQPTQTPIDFTDFLNLEDEQLNALNDASGSLENKKL